MKTCTGAIKRVGVTALARGIVARITRGHVTVGIAARCPAITLDTDVEGGKKSGRLVCDDEVSPTSNMLGLQYTALVCLCGLSGSWISFTNTTTV